MVAPRLLIGTLDCANQDDLKLEYRGHQNDHDKASLEPTATVVFSSKWSSSPRRPRVSKSFGTITGGNSAVRLTTKTESLHLSPAFVIVQVEIVTHHFRVRMAKPGHDNGFRGSTLLCAHVLQKKFRNKAVAR
jgi:hypothetical protein